MKATLHLLITILLSTCLNAQTFSEAQIISTGGTPFDLEFADLDGDGDSDAIGADNGFDEFFWQENLGGGVFGGKQQLSGFAESATDVEVADLDNDGDLDIVTAAYGGTRVAWQENLGAGNFAPPQILNMFLGGTFVLHLVDFNQDGLIDILAGALFGYMGTGDGYVGWFPNLGSGNFGPLQQITASLDGPTGLNTGDFDGDGDLDVICTDFYIPQGLYLFENLGGEVFAGATTITTALDGAYNPEIGDLDGDGDLDIVSVSTFDSKLAWYENDGSGNFGPQQVIVSTFTGPRDIELDDFDGDGDLDIVASIYFDSLVVLLRNDGSASFVSETLVANAGLAWSISVADIDGDGDRDLGVTDRHADLFTWYVNSEVNACDAAPDGLSFTLDGPYAGTTNEMNLDWNEAVGAASYRIKVKRVSPGPKKKKLFETSESSLEITGFTFPPGDMYKWSVKSACVTDTSDWAAPSSILIPSARFSTISSTASPTISSTVPWAILSPSQTEGITVYPNPVKQTAYVSSIEMGKFQLSVFDVNGKIIHAYQGETNDPLYLEIKVVDWPKGTYVYHLSFEERTATDKEFYGTLIKE